MASKIECKPFDPFFHLPLTKSHHSAEKITRIVCDMLCYAQTGKSLWETDLWNIKKLIPFLRQKFAVVIIIIFPFYFYTPVFG